MYRLDKKNQTPGYIALISILILGAVGVAVAVSVLLMGLNNSKTSFAVEQSNQSKALANACAETALQQIKNLNSYSGTGNLSTSQGNCAYTVTNTGGQNRTVTASGTVGTIIRKISISISAITPTIAISSWQEVAN
ncbi:MAG: hypothetical protein WCT08_06200 [Patescibacteria group bacterium]|jgi:hypothetical protein